MFDLDKLFDEKIEKVKQSLQEVSGGTVTQENISAYLRLVYDEILPPPAKLFVSCDKFVATAMKRKDELLPVEDEQVEKVVNIFRSKK